MVVTFFCAKTFVFLWSAECHHCAQLTFDRDLTIFYKVSKNRLSQENLCDNKHYGISYVMITNPSHGQSSLLMWSFIHHCFFIFCFFPGRRGTSLKQQRRVPAQLLLLWRTLQQIWLPSWHFWRSSTPCCLGLAQWLGTQSLVLRWVIHVPISPYHRHWPTHCSIWLKEVCSFRKPGVAISHYRMAHEKSNWKLKTKSLWWGITLQQVFFSLFSLLRKKMCTANPFTPTFKKYALPNLLKRDV